MSKRLLLAPALLAVATCCPPAAIVAPSSIVTTAPPAAAPTDLRDPRETHLGPLRQLTFGGENAEAYWSSDGAQLIFQTTQGGDCDRIMRMPADGSAPPTLVSSGAGRTTCSYFFPGDRDVLYASTHAVGAACPPPPDHSLGYVWALYDYDIYKAPVAGGAPTALAPSPGHYDAEATVCSKDGSIVFTSDRDGDLELYRMDADGGNVVRLTSAPGYDGGAFFSPDCSQLVWRASRPQGEALADYQALLGKHLVRPTKLELWVGNADGSEARQITYLDAASFAPYFHPSGRRVVFSSNVGDPKGREFDLWAVDVDGSNLERITWTPGFDGFPMFSPDGKRLAFASNRRDVETLADGTARYRGTAHPAGERDTNVFVADWIEAGAPAGAAGAAGPVERFRDAVAWLADDARDGRGVGTAGLTASAGWVEDRLRALGVEPGVGAGYRQPVEVVARVSRGPGTRLSVDGKVLAADAFVPLSASRSGPLVGTTVFVGHGITARDLGHDDYKGKAVKGKIVVVRRFVPDGKGFADGEARARYGDLDYKAFNARQHGAIGLIVVDVTGGGKDGPAEAPLPALEPRTGADAGLVTLAVTAAAGATLVGGKHRIDAAVELVTERVTVDNVVGIVRAGTAGERPGVIVVGAHLDHLGQGGPGSLETAAGIHNGADDNASGIAALLEVAASLVARRGELHRDVVLVAFTAEEMGTLGSDYFVKHLPASPVVAMLNMDMVGRMRGNRLAVLGAESAAEWPALVVPACQRAGVECALSGSGYGPSDHMPFYVAGVPVLHVFTGAHLDYHRTSDDARAINAAGGVQAARIVSDVAVAVAAVERPLTYQKLAAPPSGGDVRARGASLGTVPTYNEDPSAAPGVLLSDVVPDGAAARAGLRGGDRIVRLGDVDVRNVHDLMFVLGTARPGQAVTIVYVRAGKRLTAEATYGVPRSRR